MLGSRPPVATWLAKATAASHSLPLPGRLHVASIREEYAGPVTMARRPEGAGVGSEERWNVLDPLTRGDAASFRRFVVPVRGGASAPISADHTRTRGGPSSSRSCWRCGNVPLLRPSAAGAVARARLSALDRCQRAGTWRPRNVQPPSKLLHRQSPRALRSRTRRSRRGWDRFASNRIGIRGEVGGRDGDHGAPA